MYRKPVEYGGIKMIGSMDTLLEFAGIEYQIKGEFLVNGDSYKMFQPDAAGNLVYVGSGGKFLVIGTSGFAVSGACRVTCIMSVNGENKGETPHDFDSPAKTQNVSIADFIDLKYGDTIKAKAKSDTDNITMTPITMSLPFLKIDSLRNGV